MIYFFGNPSEQVYAVQTANNISQEDTQKLVWLFGDVPQIEASTIDAFFIGPRAAMITPWSTNAVEITQNMGIDGIVRIEEFASAKANATFDPMISQQFENLHQEIFTVEVTPEKILPIDCLLYTSPSPRDQRGSRMPSSA